MEKVAVCKYRSQEKPNTLILDFQTLEMEEIAVVISLGQAWQPHTEPIGRKEIHSLGIIMRVFLPPILLCWQRKLKPRKPTLNYLN